MRTDISSEKESVPAWRGLRDSWRSRCLGWGLKDVQVLDNCRGGSLCHGGDRMNKGPEEGCSGKDGKNCQTQGEGFVWGELGKGLGSERGAVGACPPAMEVLL